MNGNSSSPSPANLAHAAARRRRQWLPLVGLALLAALIAAGLWPQPIRVETATLSRGALRATVDEEGRTRIKQRYTVSAPVAGQLRRLTLSPGDAVQANQTLLAVIDPVAPALLDARARAATEARRDAADASLAKARAAHDFARKELKRFEQLSQQQTIATQEWESVQWREVSAARELAAAESALQQIEAELADFASHAGISSGGAGGSGGPTEVRAPAGGRVLRIFQESARVVMAGTPLLEIGEPTDLEVVIEVLSRDGAALAPGTPVWLEQWGGGPALQARVRLVEPAAFTKVSALGVEEQRVRVIADLVTPPEQRRTLGDSFRVEAHIVMWEAADVLKVPAGAVFRRGPQWQAFAVVDGRAVLRAVQVGRSSGTETQILDGLKEGETVIVYPGDRVSDGQRVRPVRI
jgi:HlyD family secretion protein